MISVIIPAHNEANVLGACLDTLLDGATDDLDVIVVANACTDDTADVARRYGPAVRVIDTPQPGKANALNLGDEAARGFPRVYLDADIRLPHASLRRLERALVDGPLEAAAPTPRIDSSGANAAVRGFYQAWFKTDYHRKAMVGSGVYAVSEAGRQRFDRFPDIIADDAFIRLQFPADRRDVLSDCWFELIPPRNLTSLIKIKTRCDLGNRQLRDRYPELSVNESPTRVRIFTREQLSQPFALTCYLIVKAAARCRSAIQFRQKKFGVWERDDSSRSLSTAAA